MAVSFAQDMRRLFTGMNIAQMKGLRVALDNAVRDSPVPMPGVLRARHARPDRDPSHTNLQEALKEAGMSSAEARSNHASSDAAAGTVDMHLEVQIIPVSDVDRSKQFYQRLGWRLDNDVAPLDGLRIVQFTPPGSAASVTFGTGLTAAAPGSSEGGLIVADIEAARGDLADRGIDASEIWHGPPFPAEARQPGPDPARTSYGSFFSFTDPDGNTWLVQEVTTRLPGRVDAAGTAFASAADLAGALRRAEAAHREHEKRTGRSHLFHRPDHDGDWPSWYAAYLVAEQAGTDLPA